MKSLKAALVESKSISPIPQFPIPVIDEARWKALNNVILQSRLACDQAIPDADFIDMMIISWNRALRRIPTQYLEPSLQYAIESHRGVGKITCSAIFQAYREMIRTKTSSAPRLDLPKSTPPKEYYELLAKFKIFPKPPVERDENNHQKKNRQRPEYRIDKHPGKCTFCGKEVPLVVIYQESSLCLDCANQKIFVAK